MNALPYEDPSIETILILSSFFLLLNGVDRLLNVTVYCGLLGQILVGIAWGAPGLKLLSEDVERTATQLGYIGLVLLVFEGGLLSSSKSLQSTLWLSIAVAATGVTVPIGLSFLLRYLTDATLLQCFAAGAALCSTSLGTTITVLQTSGYVHTRLGTVLTSAALLDDVVGLLMAQVIQDLGVSQSSLNAVDIVRPIASSIALMVVMVLVCKFCVRPITAQVRSVAKSPRLSAIYQSDKTALIGQLGLLLGLVTAASYAGASNLLAAYIAGTIISWWSTECNVELNSFSSSSESSSTSVASPSTDAEDTPESTSASSNEDATGSVNDVQNARVDPHFIYDAYLAQVVNRVLKPLFFASIGFSVPLTRMFSPEIVWRGMVYSVLMTFGKVIAGLWLIRFGFLDLFRKASRMLYGNFKRIEQWTKRSQKQNAVELRCDARSTTAANTNQPDSTTATGGSQGPENLDSASSSSPPQEMSFPTDTQSNDAPTSLYPGLILGSAMVSRGEIGYLISSLAQSSGLLSQQSPSGARNENIYLVVVWAISLCTLLGPLVTGLLVRRVKKLEAKEGVGGRAFNPLGTWGERS